MRFLADENFNNDILRGVLRENPDFDVIRVQDTELYQADDPTVLELAAKENRILLTHDVTTMTQFAYQRVERGLLMPGVVQIGRVPLREAIDALLTFIGTSEPSEWENRVTFLPLR